MYNQLQTKLFLLNHINWGLIHHKFELLNTFGKFQQIKFDYYLSLINGTLGQNKLELLNNTSQNQLKHQQKKFKTNILYYLQSPFCIFYII
jgi:hypothetical protein